MPLVVSALINGFIIILAFGLRVIIGYVLPWEWPDFVFTLLTVAALGVAAVAVVRLGRDAARWFSTRFRA
ncbi:MAG TPA: hypothetical protein VIK33_06950 [Anaerolineae bacterium]